MKRNEDLLTWTEDVFGRLCRWLCINQTFLISSISTLVKPWEHSGSCLFPFLLCLKDWNSILLTQCYGNMLRKTKTNPLNETRRGEPRDTCWRIWEIVCSQLFKGAVSGIYISPPKFQMFNSTTFRQASLV